MRGSARSYPAGLEARTAELVRVGRTPDRSASGFEPSATMIRRLVEGQTRATTGQAMVCPLPADTRDEAGAATPAFSSSPNRTIVSSPPTPPSSRFSAGSTSQTSTLSSTVVVAFDQIVSRLAPTCPLPGGASSAAVDPRLPGAEPSGGRLAGPSHLCRSRTVPLPAVPPPGTVVAGGAEATGRRRSPLRRSLWPRRALPGSKRAVRSRP